MKNRQLQRRIENDNRAFWRRFWRRDVWSMAAFALLCTLALVFLPQR